MFKPASFLYRFILIANYTLIKPKWWKDPKFFPFFGLVLRKTGLFYQPDFFHKSILFRKYGAKTFIHSFFSKLSCFLLEDKTVFYFYSSVKVCFSGMRKASPSEKLCTAFGRLASESSVYSITQKILIFNIYFANY